MSEIRINDEWILNQLSSKSISFTHWINNLMKMVEKSLEDAPSEIVEQVKKKADFNSLKALDKELAIAQKEMTKLGGLGKKFTRFGMKLLDKLQNPIEKTIKMSL